MKEHLANAAYGILDYAAYPIGMLLVAPVVLRNMGTAQYGVWAIATAVVGVGSIVASGLGDANIQHVASSRGMGQQESLKLTVRIMIGINLVLSTVLAFLVWLLAPLAALHVVASGGPLQQDCLWSLRMAAFLLWLRAMESVCISTQRAFERYGAAIRVSLLARMLSLAAAAVLAHLVHRVACIVAAAALISMFGTLLQYRDLRRALGAESLRPTLDRDKMTGLLSFGIFSWLLAVCGIIVSQADRLFIGVSLGAVAASSYALCTQLAQPIYGISASGLHFLFPHLAECRASHEKSDLRRKVLTAFACNVLFVVTATTLLLMFAQDILRVWASPEIARSSAAVLPIILCSSAALGLNVSGTYALFALGHVRIVTYVNLAAAASMLLLMTWLLPGLGTYGLALARLAYGIITLLLYLPLARLLSREPKQVITPRSICEEA